MDIIEEILTRGVEEVIEKQDLEQKLRGKKRLRIKLGIDPTSPNIHIGRAVVLWKLRAFQELGHKVVFIVGDFTGLIGDTSDKESERPMMTEAQIKQNIKTYFKQASKIINPKQAEMHYNSKWLKKLGFKEIGKLADLFSLHEFEARENIAKRMSAGKRVSLREVLYPLMQGYDSVAVKADVEIGGTDQRFNLLAGRSIQPSYGQISQNILTTTILEGTDGRKMSSSWGNVINLTDEPADMFGKVMSVGDELIKKYFILATRVPLKKIDEIISSHQNPRDQKLILAEEIVGLYYGKDQAGQARESFINQFSKGQLPEEIKEFKLSPGKYEMAELLVNSGLVTSKSEARRLLEQKAIKIDRQTFQDPSFDFKGVPVVVQAGKRKFIKLV